MRTASGTASTGLYTRKHDPWTYYVNVNHSNERPYPDLAADLSSSTVPKLGATPGYRYRRLSRPQLVDLAGVGRKENFWMRLLPESATNTLPFASTATLAGE